MKKSKCNFFSKEIQYLGHILSATGIRPLPSRTYAIEHMQPPTTPKQVQAFLGIVGYYRKFIKGFAKIAKPLTLLTRQQIKFEWTSVHHTAFFHLKEAIAQAPILHYPDPDKNTLFTLKCLRQHMQNTTFTGPRWDRISYSISVTHLHGNLKEMEYNSTRGLWHLLCHH